MTKDDIITLPNPHLRQRSKKVGIINDNVKNIVQSMEAATLDWEDNRKHEIGVALAGVQIDKLLRIVVIRSNFDDKNDRTFQVFINPEITKYEGKIVEDFEGCLSIKDVYGRVPRYEKVRIKALDMNNRPVRLTVEGFLARVFQHEIDHTNGIPFIDHIRDNDKAFYRLGDDGQLEELDYDEDVRDNKTLWQ